MAHKLQILIVLISGILIGACLILNESGYKNTAYLLEKIEIYKKYGRFTEWGKSFQVIKIPSTVDGHQQGAYFYMPNEGSSVPLVVSLHTWRGDYTEYDPVSAFVENSQYAYIHPDFRGKMNSPSSCCSDLVIADIDAAIDFALSTGRVDPERIFLIGVSGGAYTALCSYFRSKHVFKKVISWLPITDLEAWYKQNIVRKEFNFARDIMACTKSKNGILNIAEAHSRSPLYFSAPKERIEAIKLDIYSGVYDGTFGNGTVPVTQASYFYNKLIRNMDTFDADMLVSERELLDLFEIKAADESYGLISGHQILLKKSSGPVSINFFAAGHEKFPEYVFNVIANE